VKNVGPGATSSHNLVDSSCLKVYILFTNLFMRVHGQYMVIAKSTVLDKKIGARSCYLRSIPGIAGTVAAVGSRRHIRHGLGHRWRQDNWRWCRSWDYRLRIMTTVAILVYRHCMSGATSATVQPKHNQHRTTLPTRIEFCSNYIGNRQKRCLKRMAIIHTTIPVWLVVTLNIHFFIFHHHQLIF